MLGIAYAGVHVRKLTNPAFCLRIRRRTARA